MAENEPAKIDHSMHDMSGQKSAAKRDRAEAMAKSRDVVAVMNAWVRETVPGANVNGGYMTLVNGSGEDVVLERIESSSFDSVEIHKMGAVDGMMKMQRVERLPIKVGDNAVLKPGGKHLMMIGPEKDLVTGDNVELILHFTSGRVQVIHLPVKK